MRHLLVRAATCATLSPGLAAAPLPAAAAYPAAPLDQHARLLTDKLQAVLGQLPYNTQRDFVPISQAAGAEPAPVRRVRQCAPGPGQRRLGRQLGHQPPGPEMFKTAPGLFMVHIPNRGSALPFTDGMGRQVLTQPALPDMPTVIESPISGAKSSPVCWRPSAPVGAGREGVGRTYGLTARRAFDANESAGLRQAAPAISRHERISSD